MAIGMARISIGAIAFAACLSAPCLGAPIAAREIYVSAEDGKPVRPGDTIATTTPDLLRLFTITRQGIRTVATLPVPASMVGPPESVKLTHDGRYAIVSAAQALGPSGGMPVVPGDMVSLIALADPERPRLVQMVQADAGASGVAIGPRDDIVLVANAQADSVSLFALDAVRLLPRATARLPARSKPVSARILPNGREALVVGGNGKLFRLSIDSGAFDPSAIDLGTSASGIALSPDGRTAYVAAADMSGGGSRTFIAAIDVATFRVTTRVALPPSAEGLALSPSGRFLEVTLLDGTNLPPDDPRHHDTGTIAVLTVRAGMLRVVARATSGRLCQGAAWSDDERTIAVQCAEDRQIDVYRFDGVATLHRLPAMLTTSGRPGALARVSSR